MAILTILEIRPKLSYESGEVLKVCALSCFSKLETPSWAAKHQFVRILRKLSGNLHFSKNAQIPRITKKCLNMTKYASYAKFPLQSSHKLYFVLWNATVCE